MYDACTHETPASILAGRSSGQPCLHDGDVLDQRHHLVTRSQRHQSKKLPGRLKTGLQDLPIELLFKIKGYLNDFTDHSTFSALCPDSAALYQEDDFKKILLGSLIGRPKCFANKNWAETARMVTKHLGDCHLCHKYMHDTELSAGETAVKVYDKAADAPWISVILNLRQSAGRYSVNWNEENVQNRPELILANLTSTHEEAASISTSHTQTEARLIEHPAMACRLAFIQPIRTVKCGFESDSVWQFGKAETMVKSQSASASYHELNARAAQAEEYRSECFNEDGITVLDLLLAASDTPKIPTDGLTGRPLVFGGILDDTLRGQNTIWVYATSQTEEPSVMVPATYAYARDHTPSNSMDWGRMAEMSYGLFDPQVNSYGYPLEVK